MTTIKSSDLLKYERDLHEKGFNLICGTDEAGRGPLVGPVVAGAVILPVGYNLKGLTDSKQLSEKKREDFFPIIKKDAIAYGIGIVDAKTIDEINIYEASRKAMKEAIRHLHVNPDYILTDAMPMTYGSIPVLPIIHGDALSITIAAASVIAKVTRDHIMLEMDLEHPEYELKRHKGYPTKRHLELLKKYGPTKDYRFTYKPVIEVMGVKKDEEKISE